MAKDDQPQKWEYLQHSINRADLEQLGNEGWELVALYSDRQSAHPMEPTAIFKRPK